MDFWDIAVRVNPITGPFVLAGDVIGHVGREADKATDNFVQDKGEHAGEGFGRGAVRGAHEELRSILGDYAKDGVRLLLGDEDSLRRSIIERGVALLTGD